MDDAEIEAIWDGLLSRQPEMIRATYARLTGEEQTAVLAHLHRMATEPGWHAEQITSAKAALEALVSS